jgi:hypothetical protein
MVFGGVENEAGRGFAFFSICSIKARAILIDMHTLLLSDTTAKEGVRVPSLTSCAYNRPAHAVILLYQRATCANINEPLTDTFGQVCTKRLPLLSLFSVYGSAGQA